MTNQAGRSAHGKLLLHFICTQGECGGDGAYWHFGRRERTIVMLKRRQSEQSRQVLLERMDRKLTCGGGGRTVSKVHTSPGGKLASGQVESPFLLGVSSTLHASSTVRIRVVSASSSCTSRHSVAPTCTTSDSLRSWRGE